MTKITSVNLDEEAELIAEHIPNLSSFVRESLKRWANQNRAMAENEHLHFREKMGICWPFSSRGLCHTCYPDGPPPAEAWYAFNQIQTIHENQHHRYGDIEWLRDQARNHTETAQFSLRDMHFNRFKKSGQDQKTRRGFFARLRAFLGR